MPKLKKRARKLAARAVRHEMVQKVAEKLITAAILAIIAKVGQSRAARKFTKSIENLAQSGQSKLAAGRKRAGKGRTAEPKRS